MKELPLSYVPTDPLIEMEFPEGETYEVVVLSHPTESDSSKRTTTLIRPVLNTDAAEGSRELILKLPKKSKVLFTIPKTIHNKEIVLLKDDKSPELHANDVGYILLGQGTFYLEIDGTRFLINTLLFSSQGENNNASSATIEIDGLLYRDLVRIESVYRDVSSPNNEFFRHSMTGRSRSSVTAHYTPGRMALPGNDISHVNVGGTGIEAYFLSPPSSRQGLYATN